MTSGCSLFPDPTKATVTVNVTYKVGSRNENYGETGMAHLLEHLLFKGSTEPHEHPPGADGARRAPQRLDLVRPDELLRDASRPPTTTSNGPSSSKSDRMVHSFIAKKDLDSEMTVVRNEFELGENDPGNILGERVLSTAYLWHNYGHSTIGARADIENVPIERLQAFYRTYYQPDNAVLLVAGRFDEAKTLALINDTFGRIPKPTRALSRPTRPSPRRTANVASNCGGSAICRPSRWPITYRPAPIRTPLRLACSTPSSLTHRLAVSTRRSSRPGRRRRSTASICISTIPAFC